MSNAEVTLDFQRADRLGFGEAVLCADKSPSQIDEILRRVREHSADCLLTRLAKDKLAAVAPAYRQTMDYDPVSQTAFFDHTPRPATSPKVAVVTAGTSDARPAREALRTLEFHGIAATAIFDVGVAGIWRLMDRADEIARHPVVIAVAGMDAALPSVLGGLVPGVLIAVPTSVGYGVARAGETALFSCLVSCAPGVTVCNIDNGYGAACAAIRALRTGHHAGTDTGKIK
jgi:pyridinium-3,5-biscarboxylic acid mononucleotide synthase